MHVPQRRSTNNGKGIHPGKEIFNQDKETFEQRRSSICFGRRIFQIFRASSRRSFTLYGLGVTTADFRTAESLKASETSSSTSSFTNTINYKIISSTRPNFVPLCHQKAHAISDRGIIRGT